MPLCNPNETYVPNVATALNHAGSALVLRARVATTAALAANTQSGAGNTGTLTANSTGALTIDGVSVAAGDMVLVANEATGKNNGFYRVVNAGGASAKYVLTRELLTASSDLAAPVLVITGNEGTANPSAVYILNGAAGLTIDSSTLTFVKVSSINSNKNAVIVEAVQASSASAVAEFAMGGLAGSGTIIAAYYFPSAASTPASGSNSQTLAITRYNAAGSSQGVVASAAIANATPTAAFTRFSLGTIANGSYSDGDVLSAKTTLVGTATIPQGVWMVVCTPN